MSKQLEIKYFKTYEEALEAAKLVPLEWCVNAYQWSNESKKPEVRQYKIGFAVQFGDCGDYLNKKTFKELTRIKQCQ